MARSKVMLDDIERLLPPPEHPSCTGDADGWVAVEGLLGVGLPTDYKQFVNVYGRGSISGEFAIHTPFDESGAPVPELRQQALNADALLETDCMRDVQGVGGGAPYPLFPTPGGLLVCASTGTGVDICWLTSGEPDEWPVLYAEDPPWVRYDGQITALLYDLLRSDVRGEHLEHLFDHVTEPLAFETY